MNGKTPISSKFHNPITDEKGYLIAIAGTIVWSSTAVIIRFININYSITPLMLAMIRDAMAGVIIFVCIMIFSPGVFRNLRGNILYIVVFGFVLSLFNMTWTVSVNLNGAAISTVLAYSSPVFTLFAGWLLYRERLGWLKILLAMICLVGCFLVSGAGDINQWNHNSLGIIMGLISGFAFAGYSLMGKGAARRGLNSWAVLAATFLIAAGFLLIYNLLFPTGWGISSPQLLWSDQDLRGWLLLLLLAAVPTIGGYGLYNLSLKYLPAGTSNLIATSEPVFTALQAVLFLHERYSFMQIGGSLLILLSIVILRIYYKE